jgi:hypothetical protein
MLVVELPKSISGPMKTAFIDLEVAAFVDSWSTRK